ncbi:MAG: hypothetical protein J6386_22445 [Candidatus Synoicihabitans palmerolidicus]|nr:hypothetical protein [Candidatus Synoicihabitans palmerolidicus]
MWHGWDGPAAQGCGGGEPGEPFVRNAALGRDVASGGIVEVGLPDGTRLRGGDPIAMAALVKALRN